MPSWVPKLLAHGFRGDISDPVYDIEEEGKQGLGEINWHRELWAL